MQQQYFYNYEMNYIYFGTYFIICLLLSCVMLLLAFIFAPKLKDKEKLAAYECGFSPFSDARLKSQVHFVVVAIFFGIFDIEVLFILPWAYSIGSINKFGLFSGIFFIMILVLSFIYELNKKALVWK